MPRNQIMTTGQGIIAFLFMIVASIGTVFQFIYSYQHFTTVAPGNTFFIILYTFSISSMVSGGSAILWTLLGSSKFQLIIAGFLIMGFALVLPIYAAVTTGFFPYVIGTYSQVPWLFSLPTAPMLDFVGFWLAAAGGLMSMIFGFAVPKKGM